MSRWFQVVAVAVALLGGRAAAGQSGRGPAAATTVVPSNARAQMWAATARFVYQDDPALKIMQAELLQTVKDNSIPAFNGGVDAAVRVEKQFLRGQQRVLKFQGMVKTIQDRANPNDFGGLGQAIIAELRKNPERMADQERKSSLNALANQLNRLATGDATTAAEAASTAPTIAEITDVAATSAQDTGNERYAVADSSQQPETAYDTITPAAMPTFATSPLVWAALLLAGLSLLGVIYLLLTRKSVTAPRQRSSPQDVQLSEAQFTEVLSLVRKEIKAQLAAPAAPASKAKPVSRAAPPSQPAQAPAPAPVAAPEPVVQFAPEPEPTDHLFAVEAPAAPIPLEPAASRVHTLYANQQPINGAFLRDYLADAPASYTIFEILIDERTPDQGTFVVTRNESGHGGYIGSHMSILEPACVYNYPQGPASRIITETPGTVQRLPSGDWQINQKARIYFA